MRLRPVRPNIYLPVVRFGVVASDWKYVLVVTLISYLVPFFFRLKVGNVPLWFVTGVVGAGLSYSFFRYTKVGRSPYWFQHSVRALLDGRTARPVSAQERQRRNRKWLLD